MLIKGKLGLAASVLALIIVGCGGSGTSAALPSLYRGSWTGNWSSSSMNEASTVALTVLADGSFTGTMGRSGGQSGTFVGVINNQGRLSGSTGFAASGNYLIGGSVTLTNGSLTGSMAISYLGQEYLGSFNVAAGGGAAAGPAAGEK